LPDFNKSIVSLSKVICYFL